MRDKKNTGIKIVCNNRKASFNYFFHEFFEAGLVLKGSEVKALRDGKANITDAYANDSNCLLYTSDAADEGLGVDLGGRRIIKKNGTRIHSAFRRRWNGSRI